MEESDEEGDDQDDQWQILETVVVVSGAGESRKSVEGLSGVRLWRFQDVEECADEMV